MAHTRILFADERYLYGRTGAPQLERNVTAATQRLVAPSAQPRAHTTLIGVMILAGVLALLAWPQVFPHVLRLQTSTSYKIASGATLLSFVAFQWLLAIARSRRWLRTSKLLYSLHQAVGLLGPLFLYLHSARWGFGYLIGLAAALLANHAVGLVHGTGHMPKWASATWLVTHVALSVLVLALAGYHACQVLYRG